MDIAEELKPGGTFKFKPVDQIRYGLKEFDEDRKQDFLYLIKSPFISIERIGSEELRKGNENDN